ncbi:hypothetical protein JQK62_18765, partial [Leptospira santarosai]|nr:hypothetical protein [Leptospira santarosai]
IGGIMLAGLIFVLLKKMNISSERETVDYSAQIAAIEEELTKAEHLANQVRLYKERLDQLKQKYQDQQRVIMNIEHSLNMEEEKQKETKEHYLIS